MRETETSGAAIEPQIGPGGSAQDRLEDPFDGGSRAPSADQLEALVLAAQSGDRKAFRKLFLHFAPMVHAVALGSVDAHTADDVTQEVFLAAWRSLGQLRDQSKVAAWLATLARNRARRVAARAGNAEENAGSPSDLELLSNAASDLPPSEKTSALPSESQVLEHLRLLPEAYRVVLTLRLVEQKSGPEIARILNRTPESIRVNLHRGLSRLKVSLGRVMEIDHE